MSYLCTYQYLRMANMKQEYAWAHTEKPENKNTKKETATDISFQIENNDIKEQYTIQL